MIPKMDYKLSSTASDPQSRPRMIPKEKQEWLGLKLADHRVDFIIITKSQKFYFSNKYIIKTKWKKHHSSVKAKWVGNTRLLPHAKMLLVLMNLSLAGRLYLWRKTFWLSKCNFCRLFHTDRSWHAFSAVIVLSGRHDLPFDARAFPLTSFEMQCSSLSLNKGFRLINFLQSASRIRIIISDFLLVRECDGFLRCFVTQ